MEEGRGAKSSSGGAALVHATQGEGSWATAASGASGGLAVHEATGGGFEQKRQGGRHFSPQKARKKVLPE